VNGRPNDQRGFVHKRLIGAVGGLLTGNPLSAISGFVRGGGGGRSSSPVLQQLEDRGRPCHPSDPRCAPPRVQERVPGLRGFAERLLPGGRSGFQDVEFGDARVGQFGAGLEPAQFETVTRRCPRGAVLGVDGLCYNRRDIRNSERMWPKGRAPLLTGGEMRCITIASRAAAKLERKEKQLRKMGMLKALPRRTMKRLAPGHHAHVSHD